MATEPVVSLPYSELTADQAKLVATFFFAVARIEFALKRNGDLKTHEPDSKAEPNWSKLTGLTLPVSNLGGAALLDAAKYFWENPPKVQKVDGDRRSLVFKPHWRTTEVASAFDGRRMTIGLLVDFVKTVRNNLFHGGKFAGFLVKEGERDAVLIRHSLAVLEAVLQRDESLKGAFLAE